MYIENIAVAKIFEWNEIIVVFFVILTVYHGRNSTGQVNLQELNLFIQFEKRNE